MLSDDEILGLWSEGKAQPPARPVLGMKKVLAFARAVERAVYKAASELCDSFSAPAMGSQECCTKAMDVAEVIARRALGRQHD